MNIYNEVQTCSSCLIMTFRTMHAENMKNSPPCKVLELLIWFYRWMDLSFIWNTDFISCCAFHDIWQKVLNHQKCLLPLFKFLRTPSLCCECWWVLIKCARWKSTCDSQRYLLDVYLLQSMIISLSHYLSILVCLHLLHCAKWVLLRPAFVLEKRGTGWLVRRF